MASKTKGNSVAAYLATLSPAQRKLVQAVRRLVRATAPKLKETMKWGFPCYLGVGNVCSVVAYRDYVNLALFRGAELAKKSDLIEGSGKAMRHIKFRTLADVGRKQVATIIRQAVRLDAASDKDAKTE